MNSKLLRVFAGLILLIIPNINYGQTAPTLGTAANFVLFTTNGGMTNSGIKHLTHLTGNVGSNLAGAISGFGNVDGQEHDFDVATAACVTDVLSLYSQLNLATTTFSPVSPILGNGDTLVAGVYQYPLLTAASLNLNLILNAEGNPNAVFIIKIDGAFSTTTSSKVILANGALACNVFWKVEGMVNMASGSTMRGTIVANNAAINMNTLDTLEGRALSIDGAVTVTEILAYTPLGCGSTILTGPTAPALDSAGSYGVFSSIGGVTSTPTTYVTGNVGSNSTTTTGFNPLNVTGTIHTSLDASTAACASALTNVYNYLNGLTADIDLLDPTNFGFNLVLTPHTYLLSGATMLNDSVYLNAENDPNAVFVIQVNGAFTTTTYSNVRLINGAQAQNVYWLINGATHIYDNSVFNGQIIGAGAITLNTGDTLNGRALTINGAVAINGSSVHTTQPPCSAPPIGGIMNICQGNATTLTDSTSGGIWSSTDTAVATVDSVSGMVTGITAGTADILYTTITGCESTTTMTVNPTPSVITGPGGVCIGDSIILNDSVIGGIWSSGDTAEATVDSLSGVVKGVSAGVPAITYTLAGGCTANKSVTVNSLANAGTITGPVSVCTGSTVTLADTMTGGTWSSSNTTAAVSIGGVVTGNTTGIDTIRYTIVNVCGTATATKNIAVNPQPNAGIITGASTVCAGASVTLTDTATGGAWSSSNTTASVSTAGIVTGVAGGIDSIIYAVTNVCGTDTAMKAIAIIASPVAGIISGPSDVCIGSIILFTETAPGGAWNSSNTTATVIGGVVTGIMPGADTISYSVTNVCGTATATKNIAVNPQPNAGIITGASTVCAGASVTLTDTATGGAWSSSNATATNTGGMVTGISPGTDTISYVVTNICGTSTATKTITVNQLPTAASITIQPTTDVCTGTSFQNFGTTTLPPASVTYDWTAVNATVWAQGTDHQNSLVNFDLAGTAYVTLTTSMTATGCTSENTVAISVGTNDADVMQVIYSEGNLICLLANVTTYQWGYDDYQTLDSTLLPGEINQNYSIPVLDVTKFYWVITVHNGCMQKTYYKTPSAGDHRTTASYGNAVQPAVTATEVKVYPNPATEMITVSIVTSIPGDIQVQVMNLLGQPLISTQAINDHANINVAGLPAGTYLIDCYRGGLKISAVRFVKN